MSNRDKQLDQIKKLKDEQRKVTYSILMSSGFALVFLGLLGLLSPTLYTGLLNTGATSLDTIQFYSGLVAFVGLSDIIIATILFKRRKTL